MSGILSCLALLLTGCDGCAVPRMGARDEQRACRLIRAGDFGACATGKALTVDEHGPRRAVISGVVEAIGPAGTACSGIGRIEDLQDAYRFTVRDAETTLELTLLLPWSKALVSTGDTVHVEYAFSEHSFSPSEGRLELRDAQGNVLLWMEETARGPASLRAPAGVHVEQGATRCSYRDSCGIHTNGSLRVRAGGAEADIPIGGRAEAGAYVFVNGESTQFEFTGGCTDIGSSHVLRIVAVRGNRDSLAAREIGPCGGALCKEGEYCAAPRGDCDGASAGAVCEPAPAACGLDCPMVCGCDGKLYCNACRAQQAGTSVREGDTSCKVGDCSGKDGVAMSGPCNMSWSCYGREYSFSCDEVHGVQRCLCRSGGSVVRSVESKDPQCNDVDALCGFPPRPF